MKRIAFFSLAICTTLAIVWGIFALALAEVASDTSKKAEQHFEKAVERIRQLMYEDAIAEFEKVITLVPESKMAHDAQYWIGQAYFRAGQFDDALSTFEKLIYEYPESAIIPVTQLMVSRVQLAKDNEKLKRTTNSASDSGVIIDPETGVKYTRVKTFAGKRDVLGHFAEPDLSPNGKFLLEGNAVIPLDGGDPFELVDMPVRCGRWSPDGKKVALHVDSEDPIWVVPVSSETARQTGPPRKFPEDPSGWGTDLNWSSDSEKLVFSKGDKEIRSEFDIWTLSVGDGSLKQITNDPGREYSPVWSPDDSTIAYGKTDRNVVCYGSTWLIPAAGGAAREFIDSGGGCQPTWSADGKWITSDSNSWFRLIDKQKIEINAPEEVGSFFSWSPDGKKMLFYRSSYDWKGYLKVVSTSGGPSLELGRHLSFWVVGQWSPDSKMILTQAANEDAPIAYWMIPITGGNQVLMEMDILVDGKKPDPRYMSPDMKKLVFTVDREDGREDIYVVPISLEETRSTGSPTKVLDGWNRIGGYNAVLQWSPDGSKLAVIQNDDLWIAYPNGDRPLQLTKTSDIERYPEWTPDGKIVTYIVNPTKEYALHLIPASGGKATKIVSNCRSRGGSPNGKELVVISKGVISIFPIAGGEGRQIAKLEELGLEDNAWELYWTPDGQNLAFMGRKKGKEYRQIFIIPAEGGKATQVTTDDDEKYWFSWSPDGKWISYYGEGSVKMRPEGAIWEADFEEILGELSD